MAVVTSTVIPITYQTPYAMPLPHTSPFSPPRGLTSRTETQHVIPAVPIVLDAYHRPLGCVR